MAIRLRPLPAAVATRAEAHNRPALGIALKLGGAFAFTLMYAAIRLAGKVPTGEVVFFRGFFAVVPVLVLAAGTIGIRATVRTSKPWLHLRRSLTGVVSMFLNFAAIPLLPLASITAFGFAAPIFAVVLAAILLREQVGPYRWSAVVAGLGGVLVMLSPHGGLAQIATHGFSTGSALALGAAFLSAIVVILIRQMHTTEDGQTIVFYFMCTCSLAGAVSMIFDRVALSWSAAGWLILSGLLGGIGQIGMTFSYRYAEPSLLAPFDYTAMVWAVALGWFVFAEVPDRLVLAGAGIVIAAGLFIVWRERQRRLARTGAIALAG